jgi:hypothetical protein
MVRSDCLPPFAQKAREEWGTPALVVPARSKGGPPVRGNRLKRRVHCFLDRTKEENGLKRKKVEYVRSVVSYIDILGFRELVEAKSAGEISRILRILATSTKPKPTSTAYTVRFTKFSDTVIRSIPATDGGHNNLLFEVQNILNAQIRMVSEGILLRGVVTVGDIVQSWGIVYGPAVVRAYNLESQKGSPPRVILDPEALAEIPPIVGGSLDFAVMVANDGHTRYIDYLSAGQWTFSTEQEYFAFLRKHRDLIRRGLGEFASNPSVLPKYEWLTEYHERTLRILGTVFHRDAPKDLKV